MALTDLIKDLIDTAKERLKTPISGAFLWSFIIYNWRPILLLVFSNASIENKIIVINHEYCNFWAIFWPLVLATFYTVLIPKIMLQIENDLAPTQDKRVTKRYESEKHLVKQKTNVAREEFLLKNAESGNKEIQELLNQIESLKQQNESLQESIKQINDSNKRTIDELNNSLKLANSNVKIDLSESDTDQLNLIEYSKFLEKQELMNKFNNRIKNLSTKSRKEILNIVENLTRDEISSLEGLTISESGQVIRYTNLPTKTLSSLVSKKLINREKTENSFRVTLTDNGYIIYNILKTD
ncbi:hypothetical protein HYN56_14080 [Flavobacterium crocinum]|uniref:Uncharacterized protein n=1 Tax=Flavobacterium crocinum TaxID=2183896 RepID=A0A2S1YMR0_9FLAO|nr:hypothetical protein [Flavobacterium crocinum]AWK05302.1 hypothetical protein HYN56_14080 [Flavobacterium crocinum]